MTAKLTWPFLGYYGPQSGIEFSEATERDDYAEEPDEMLDLFKNCLKPIERFDIEPNEFLSWYCGGREIENYFESVWAFTGKPFKGKYGEDFSYEISKKDNKWKFMIEGENLEIRFSGPLENCVETFLKNVVR